VIKITKENSIKYFKTPINIGVFLLSEMCNLYINLSYKSINLI